MPKKSAKKSRQQLAESESSSESDSDSYKSGKLSQSDDETKKKSKTKTNEKSIEINKKRKKRTRSTSSSSSSSSSSDSSSSSSSSNDSNKNADSKSSNRKESSETKGVDSVRRKIPERSPDRRHRVREENENRSGHAGFSGGSENRSKWDSPSRDDRDRRNREHYDRKHDNLNRDRQFDDRDRSGRSNNEQRNDKYNRYNDRRHDNPFDRDNREYYKGNAEPSREHQRNVRDNRNRDDRDNRNRDDRSHNRSRDDRDNNIKNYRDSRNHDDRDNRRDRNRSTERNRSTDRNRSTERNRNDCERDRNDGRRYSRSPRRSRNYPKRNEDDDKNYDWGKKKSDSQEPEAPPIEKEKPNFGLSGKLIEDTNKVNGTVIKYSEPQEARKPKRRWRLYPFKGEKALPTMYIHRQSCFLIGRDRKICDLPVDHPSCSKQHAVLQYRLIPFEREDGTMGKRVRPYLLDLESANGTFLNNKPILPKKYYELIEKDVIKFGFSSREYVLLHENSKEDELDDDVLPDEEIIKQERD